MKYLLSPILCLIFHYSLGDAQSIISPNVKSHFILDSQKSQTLAWVLYSKEKSLLVVEALPLTSFLQDKITEEALRQISLTQVEGYISDKQLKESGITLFFDEATLDIRVIPDENLRTTKRLHIRGKRTDHSKDLLKPSSFSSYFNAQANHSFFQTPVNNGLLAPLSLSTQETNSSYEWVNNIKGLVLENEIRQSSASPLDWERTRSRIVYDLPKSMLRFAVGDINHPTTGYQRLISGAGLSVTKLFEINPLFFQSAARKTSISITKPSTMEVYLNDRMVLRKAVSVGPLELTDFPFYSGENNIHIKLIDEYGRVIERDFNAIYDPRILTPGLSEFSFNLEAPNSTSTISSWGEYETDNPSFTSFYRLGITDTFMAGFNAQFDKNQSLWGSDATLAHKLGVSNFDLAFSNNSNLKKSGLGIKAETNSLLMKMGESTSYRLNSTVEYRSSNFLTTSTNLISRSYQWLFDGSVGQNFKRDIQGSFGVSHYIDWNNADETYFYSQFGWSFLNNWNFTSSYRFNIDNTADKSFYLSLNWFSPVKNTHISTNYHPIEGNLNTTASITPIEGRNELRLRTGYNSNSFSHGLNTVGEFENQRLRLTASHTEQRNKISGHSARYGSTTVGAATSLAFAGGHFALSKPIQDSFALIRAKNRPSGHELGINKYARESKVAANFWGPGVMSRMTSYYNDRVNINTEDLPLGLQLDQETFILNPSYKSGSLVEVEVTGHSALKGVLKNRAGEFIQYATGTLYMNQIKMSRFFTNDSGQFFIENLEPGTYTLVLDKFNYQSPTIEIKNSHFGVKDVGVVELRTHGQVPNKTHNQTSDQGDS